MSDWIDAPRNSRDGVTIPTIWVAFALSILMHIAALWVFPQKPVLLPGLGEHFNIRDPLTIRLVPPTPAPPVGSAPVVPPRTPPKPMLQAQRPTAVPRPQTVPPVIALKQPAPDTRAPDPGAPRIPVPAPASSSPPAPAEGDLTAYVEARRRARGAPESAQAEDDEARTKRIIAGNLDSQRDLAFGYDPTRGGGVFHVERLGYDYAEFTFYGWNKDVGRNTKQLIEVRRGNNSDIRVAVVRKMVSIIREHEQQEFLWVSRRLGRSLMLSARPADNAGLEEFMMREFFP